MVESVLAILPTLVTLVTAASDTPFDFGLFENEPILRQVLKEDLDLTTDLETLNSQYKDEFLTRFLKNQSIAIENVSIFN